MRKHLLLIVALLTPVPAFAAPSSKLLIPSFDGLARKASESVAITLDSAMLGLAGRFLDGNDPQDAATKDILKGLTGIYVRSYSFDKESAYERADLDAVRSQLSGPGWSQLMETHSSKSRSDVDIYIMIDNNQAVGLALIASEPRQFTIVNIVGAIDLNKLHKLEGQFGIPKLDLEQSKPPPGQPAPRK